MNKINIVLQGKCDAYTYEIAEHYLNLDFVNSIIISCWENDCVINSNDRITMLKSIDIVNPGNANRNRQIKSSLEGLKISDTEFSVKMRSDQKVSIDSMILMNNFYNSNKSQDLTFANGAKPHNKVCVAGIFRNFPFHPRDHIFWGNTKDLIDVFTIPYDDITMSSDYDKYLRAEAYIAMWYYGKFDNDVIKYIQNPQKYMVDNASHIQEALAKSDELGSKVFKPFPRISFEWPKHGLKSYHYDYTSKVLGEYWDD